MTRFASLAATIAAFLLLVSVLNRQKAESQPDYQNATASTEITQEAPSVDSTYALPMAEARQSVGKVVSQKSTATAFVIGDGTWMLTNKHVAKNSGSSAEIVFDDGSTAVGRFVAISRNLDLALMRINQRRQPLSLCQSTPSEGDRLYVYGYPDGADSLQRGVGYASNGYWGLWGNEESYRQYRMPTQARPGNSGSPVMLGGCVAAIHASGLPSKYSPLGRLGGVHTANQIRSFLKGVESSL